MDKPDEQHDPLAAILLAANKPSGNVRYSDAEIGATIELALTAIGVSLGDMARFRQVVANALLKARFRLPGTGAHIPPDAIIGALTEIEQGLRQIERGIGIFADARDMAVRGSPARNENVATLHTFALGQIANAVFSALPHSAQPTDEVLADAMPDHSRLGFSSSWRGVFAMAADRIRRVREAFSTDDFRLPTRPIADHLDELVWDLAGIFREAGAGEPVSPDSSGNLKPEWRSKFSTFVATIWPLSGDTPIPSNKMIRAAIKRQPD